MRSSLPAPALRMLQSSMALLIRLIRALWVFGLILGSYLFHLFLLRLFREWEIAPDGQELPVAPPWLVERRKRVDERNAKRLLAGTLSLRGVYIKLGQVLSIMGGFLPRVYAKELESLQDAVPPRPYEELVRAFQRSLGKHPRELFATIEEEPLAAASLGQVHRATLPDGRDVAVKFLYPGIRGVVATDMKVIRLAMWVYRSFVPIQNIEVVHDSLEDLLRRETDYVHEARCMERVYANYADQDDILVPEVIPFASTRDVLTMTFMEGAKITSFDEIAALGIDRVAIATRLVQCFYQQVFVDRFFHADPHPGNFLVQAGPTPSQPKIVILDFGAICDVEEQTVNGMVDVLRGFFEQRDELVLSGIETIGFHAPGGDRALLESTVKTYFEKLLKIEDRTAGALMRADASELESLIDPEVERQNLRRLMRSVRYPDGWFYVERASVLMFWLAGQIAPDLDTLQVGFPYVMPLIADRLARANA